MIDYLPMWQMYSDEAKGVCVVVEWDNTSDIPLYHMCYLNKTSTGYSLRKEDNKALDYKRIDANIKQLKSIYSSLKSLDEQLVFDELISPVVYLFKDSSYSYEQEMRIMYRFENSSKQIKHTSQDPPKLYVSHNTPLRIKEIILGPRFPGVSDVMPYLTEQVDKMSEAIGIDPPHITLSDIDFR